MLNHPHTSLNQPMVLPTFSYTKLCHANYLSKKFANQPLPTWGEIKLFLNTEETLAN
jgi:hypothetical protein